MKQEEKLTELIQAWDNKDKAQAIKVLKSSMVESKKTKASAQEVGDYVKHIIQEGIEGRSIPDYPSEDVSASARSSYYKKAIEAAVQEIEGVMHIDKSNKALEAVWENCKDSSNLVEFRKNFKLYLTALMAELYTIEEVQELTDMIDELDRENRKLKEYERIYHEIFGVLEQGDEDLNTYRKYKTLKDGNMSDMEISVILDVSRPKLSKVLKNFQSTL